MNNRKSIMTFSAFLILFFHLWVYVFPGNEVEIFLRQTAYIGVDVFFFLSGYSLSQRSVDSYKDFIFLRFKSVYIKFIIFVLIAWTVKKWSFLHVIKIILGVNLVQKGGGAFLWFLPFIMILYIIFPFFQKAHNNSPYLTFTLIAIAWIFIGLIVNYETSYTAMFIFWNRIPVFLLGFYLAHSSSFKKITINKFTSLLLGATLVIIGECLIYFFGYKNKLMIPFTDMFYVIALPTVLGVIFLCALIPENIIIKYIGSSTLEMYAIQMIFGYMLANKLILLSIPNIFVNVITFFVVIVTAILFNRLYARIDTFMRNRFS